MLVEIIFLAKHFATQWTLVNLLWVSCLHCAFFPPLLVWWACGFFDGILGGVLLGCYLGLHCEGIRRSSGCQDPFHSCCVEAFLVPRLRSKGSSWLTVGNADLKHFLGIATDRSVFSLATVQFTHFFCCSQSLVLSSSKGRYSWPWAPCTNAAQKTQWHMSPGACRCVWKLPFGVRMQMCRPFSITVISISIANVPSMFLAQKLASSFAVLNPFSHKKLVPGCQEVIAFRHSTQNNPMQCSVHSCMTYDAMLSVDFSKHSWTGSLHTK